jgi:hypothetical protein
VELFLGTAFFADAKKAGTESPTRLFQEGHAQKNQEIEEEKKTK